MMVIGIDAHKRSHTAVTIDEMGRAGTTKTVGTTTQDHLRLLRWAVGIAVDGGMRSPGSDVGASRIPDA
jgi:transposase